MLKTPVIANWLLTRFGVAERNAALMGDLAEAFQDGKSPAWYWRQTLVAIATEPCDGSRARAFTSVLTGWTAFMALHAALWLQGPFRFRLHAGPWWFHWAVALAFAALSTSPWRKARDGRARLAVATFFWCLAIDWPISTFWTEPVSSRYLMFIGVEFLTLALLNSWRAIFLKPKLL